MAAASLVRPTTSRAVHLRITPRPSKLGESREILRLISQFGEVEYFKNFKYDNLSSPNTSIVIFKHEDAAQHCLKRSPIRFRMGKATAAVTEPQKAEVEGSNATAKDEPNEKSKMAAENGSQASLTDSNSRIFQIQTNPTRANFRDLLNSSHFHGAFAIDGKSAAQQDLSKRVPSLGLSDVNWRAAEKPWTIIEREKRQNGAFRDSGKRQSLHALYNKAS